ncbi:MAG: TetR/AcrR family transcriptional regulator [Planctomycetota bacterium]
MLPVKTKKAQQSDATRSALLAVGRDLFAERGYGGVSIEELVSAVGLTKGALYHHFRDKRALFDAVSVWLVGDLISSLRQLSGDRVERAGGDRHSSRRDAAGLEILLDRLCEPALRRILLIDGPSVLGRQRWDEIWSGPMLVMLASVLRRARMRGALDERLSRPMSHLIFGAFQEAALAIGNAADPVAARASFGAAAALMLMRLLEPGSEDTFEAP